MSVMSITELTFEILMHLILTKKPSSSFALYLANSLEGLAYQMIQITAYLLINRIKTLWCQ